ncbi:MAG: hypothetical protein D3923_19710 [Candidatus Electrothrix sp. AR3]|nr:hypothetical protein [Candidatus Electrothrix sp. AR3]
MKLVVDKNIVEFTMDTPQETADMEVLWRLMVDCVADNKRMEPIGEYIPTKSNVARFIIEGVSAKTEYTDDQVKEECTVVCMICNKYSHLKPGDAIPVCCGKAMEEVD